MLKSFPQSTNVSFRHALLTLVSLSNLELAGGELDDGGVVRLRDAEVLLVEVHELHLVVGDLLLVGRLEHEGDGVGLVLRLDRDDVVVGRAPQDLRHRTQVHPHRQLPVAPTRREKRFTVKK